MGSNSRFARTDTDESDAMLRWRLIIGPERSRTDQQRLGEASEAIRRNERLSAIDDALDFLYGDHRTGGLGESTPYLPTWLGDIRRYFPRETVSYLEREAIDRRGLRQLLFEPEALASLERDMSLAVTILGFQQMMPEETRRTARLVVAEIVEELRTRLEFQIRQAVMGGLRRQQHSPLKIARNLDLQRTVRAGLRNYNRDLGSIVPERIYFHANQRRHHEWRIIVLVDQSASMGESIVQSAVIAAVFSSLPALDTRLVLFDTKIADVSHLVSDPVSLLFSVQLGGGTDIARAVGYAREHIQQPDRTLLIVLSDLYEGGDRRRLLRHFEELQEDRVTTLCALAITDKGVASYDHALAREIAERGVPTFAATPNRFIDAIERALSGRQIDADS